MRPTTLTMTAFGSYKDPTTIDFDALSSDLYLITGDTGAGKTTIFDAIVYALYGTFSGSERKPEMMHSDYADKKTDMSVCLSFTEQGTPYRVERSLHFSKNRKTGEYDCSNGKKAMLYDKDGNVIASHETGVTAKCEEITGLNADQFTKIVMLAQGQFRRFLSAGSDERQKILGKLFDDSAYKAYEQLLLNARKRLQHQRSEDSAALETVMASFSMPEGLTPEETSHFLPAAPDLLEHLEALVKEDEEKAKSAKTALDAANAAVEKQTEKKTADQQVKHSFDELAACREKLKTLENQSVAMQAQKEKNGRIDTALHRVLPLVKTRDLEKREAENVEKEIQSLTASLAALTKEKDAADAAVTQDADSVSKVQDLQAKIKTLDDSMGAFDEVADLEKQAAQKQEKKTDFEGKLAKLQHSIEALKDTLQKEKEERDGLEDADAAKEKALHALDEAKKNEEAAKDAADRLQALEAQSASLNADKADLAEKMQTSQDLAAKANGLYQTFLSEQAATLGVQLENQLQSAGEATCPVCGSHFVKGQAHRFAGGQGQNVTREEVDAARKSADDADKALQSARQAFTEKQTKYTADCGALLKDYRKLVPEADLGRLFAEGEVQATLKTLTGLRESAEKTLTAATEAAERYSKVRQKITSDETLLQKKQDNEKLGQQQISDLTAELATLTGKIGEKRQQLSYKDKNEAMGVRKSLDDQRAILQSTIDAHLAAQKKARDACSKEEGKLHARKDEAPVRAKRLEEAQQALQEAITGNGFAGEDEVNTLTAMPEGQDPETHLEALKKQVTDYENDCRNTRQKESELVKATEGKTLPDLDADEATLQSAKTAQQAAVEESEKRSGVLESHRATLHAAAGRVKALNKSQQAFEILDRLGTLAGGANAEGGQISFDRYVLASTFDEVLMMANVRLDTMTGGRYELVRREGARAKNAKAGLDISIIDHRTGFERDCATISGGEGFEASLALALGLSDVVQRRAGGRKIEALFVDEGFGTLDDEKLDNAVQVLKSLTGGGRLVGVISHVDRLREAIPTQIEVTSTGRSGSQVRLLSR